MIPSQELEIQRYLRSGKSVEQLKKEYCISFKRGLYYPNLISFKYSLIESPLDTKIAQEARSLVLDSEDNWNLVCQGFEKFFNLGEGNAAKLDLSSTIAMEKVDGSLIVAYVYHNDWQFCTTGTPDAQTPINNFGLTFRELFLQILGDRLPDPQEHKDNFWFFELISPYNKIVVVYPKPNLVALGGRNKFTREEFLPQKTAEVWRVDCVKEYPFHSIELLLKSLENVSGTEREGYVLRDANFNRLKIKSQQYISLHHLKSSFSVRKLLELIRLGEIEELIAYFPEYKAMAERFFIVYSQLVVDIETDFQKWKSIETQKEFAQQATTTNYSSILFDLRKGKYSSVKEGLKTILFSSFERMMLARLLPEDLILQPNIEE